MHQKHFHDRSLPPLASLVWQPLLLALRFLQHHQALSIRCAHEDAQNSRYLLDLMD